MFLFLLIVHILICLVLITAVLMQSGRGEGLSGAFGAGFTQTLFGTGSSNFLTRVTSISAGLFIVSTLTLAVLSGNLSRSLMEKSAVEQKNGTETSGAETVPAAEPQTQAEEPIVQE